ncbi:MAG: hypothetical protein Q4F84_02150, partial [Fibrobacter sp.]|nr:hypothetical protein [Fibrobacter sp.]
KYTVYAYSVDNVGNVSTQSYIDFVVDMSAPETKAIATKGFAAGNKTILSSAQTISLQASDSLAGVKAIWYKFAKDKNPSLYSVPIELKKFKDGEEQVLIFYSEDQVGNVEKPKQIAFIIDNTPPAGKITWEGDVHNVKDQVVVSSRTMFKIEAKDARSDIQEMFYSVNKNASVPFKAPFCITGEPGKYQIAARVADKSGNENSQINLNVVLDSKAPKSTHTFVGAMHKNEYTLWITPKTKIKLEAQDDLAGVKAVEYSYEGDAYVAYKEPFSINKEGLFILKYRGVDNVNNREEDKMIAVVVDSSSPVIEETFSSKPIASEDKSVVRFKGGTMLFLKVMDDASGIKEVVYLINGGREQKYTGPVQFTKDGTYNVEVRAKDNLGNEQRKMLKFAVVK